MTHSTVEVDWTSLEGLDFDHELPCEWGKSTGQDSCDNKAEWVLVQYCCGVRTLMCVEHKAIVDYLWETAEISGNYRHSPKAGGCGRTIENISWEKI